VSFSLPKRRSEQDFSEAHPVYSHHDALAEARRCLFCFDAPCIKACPTAIDVPTFIRKIAEGNVRGAAKAILAATILGYSCGRVCPDEVLCAGSCVLKDFPKPVIQIARLQRYATETLVREGRRFFSPAAKTGKKVALIGAGPASLACAHELRLLGHEAVLFEKRQFPGGLNTTGVAPYKMQADDALLEVDYIRGIGVEVRTGFEVGRDIDPLSLLREYDALFIGIGMGRDTRLHVPGESGAGVVNALEWIEEMKTTDHRALPSGVRHALVIGGGNTALDAARALCRLGVPEVTMLYRRTAQVMPGFRHELEAARLEGVRFVERAVVTEILRDGQRLSGARVRIMDEETVLPADFIVVAIGQTKWRDTPMKLPGVELNEAGEISVDPATGRTGNPQIYAGGDATPGMKLVVQAVAEGKRAAQAMHRDLLQHVKGDR